MTITQLKYFLAVAELLNFSKVAEQFYVAQTAISYNIKSIEEELGITLFNRTTKKVELTEAGKIFYTRVKTAVQIIDKAQTDILADPGSLNMVIGCSELCLDHSFYKAVELFGQAHPKIRLQLVSDEPELSMMDKLGTGQLDLAILMRTPFLARPASSKSRDFSARIARKIILSRQNPLSLYLEGVSVEKLRNETFISYSNMERTRLYLPSPFSIDETELSINSAIITDDFHSMLSSIRANLGIACLPILRDINDAYLCTIPCIENLEGFPSISAMYMEENKNVDAFIQIYFSVLKELYPDGHEETTPPSYLHRH